MELLRQMQVAVLRKAQQQGTSRRSLVGADGRGKQQHQERSDRRGAVLQACVWKAFARHLAFSLAR